TGDSGDSGSHDSGDDSQGDRSGGGSGEGDCSTEMFTAGDHEVRAGGLTENPVGVAMARILTGQMGDVYSDIVGGAKPFFWNGDGSPIRSLPLSNLGIIAAPGGIGLIGIPSGGYANPNPEDIGTGRSSAYRGPYSPVQPRQDFSNPGPTRSGRILS